MDSFLKEIDTELLKRWLLNQNEDDWDVKEVNDNIATVQKEYGNNEIIKGKIETEITVYLNNNFTNGDLGSLEAIKNLVKEEYMIALANVTAAKADVAKAKRNIEKLAAGTYTDTDYITESLVRGCQAIN